MWYLWLIFALVPVIMFASFCYVGSIVEKKTKIGSQQKWKVILENTFHWILLDLVYMAIFNQWMTWIFIFGSIVIIKVLYTITKVFLQKEEKQPFIAYSIIVDFIIGIGLSVYLIFIIENDVLQSIITTVIAAVYGGLLTLVGVAWTIKKSDRDKEYDEKKKAKPLFGFYTRDDIEDNGNVTICFEDSINKGKLLGNGVIEKYPLYVTAVLRNTEKATFTICRLFHTNQWWDIRVNKLIFAKGQMNFEFFCKEENDLKILEIEDVLGNKYYYQLKIKMDTNKGYKQQGMMRVKMYEAIGCDIVESIEVDLDFVKENIKEK